MAQSLEHLVIAHRLCALDPAEVAAWAESEVARSADLEPEIYRLLSGGGPDAGGLLERILTQRSQEISAEQLSRSLRTILRETLATALSNEGSLEQLHAVVTTADAYVGGVEWIDALPHALHAVIGDLWNALDWYEPTWTLDSQPHLCEAVRAARRALG